MRVNAASRDLHGNAAIVKSHETLADIDRRGIIATPANRPINERVAQTARVSIANDGQPVAVG